MGGGGGDLSGTVLPLYQSSVYFFYTCYICELRKTTSWHQPCSMVTQTLFLVQNNVLAILCHIFYSCFVSDFQCSKSCGDGKKTRSVDCVGGSNAQCDSNNRPDTVADCNYGPCPEWKVGEWQEVATSTVGNFFWCCCCCCCYLIFVTVAVTVVVVLLFNLCCCFHCYFSIFVTVSLVVVVVVAMKSPLRLLESYLKYLRRIPLKVRAISAKINY